VLKSRYFDYYLVLGDSMSMDFYPAKDLQERLPSLPNTGLGASSLFFKNRSDLWADFESRDLQTDFPGIRQLDYAFDGATADDMLHFEMVLDYSGLTNANVLTTVTVGGNDLLEIEDYPEQADQILQKVKSDYLQMLQLLKRAVPNGLTIISTLYDPTDGLGTLPDHQLVKIVPLKEFAEFNEFLRAIPYTHQNVIVADVHEVMFGHGESAGVDERWYWSTSRIEPNVRGAHEIRRSWYECLQLNGAAV
jgi:lysophospholipase L1-like esterase